MNKFVFPLLFIVVFSACKSAQNRQTKLPEPIASSPAIVSTKSLLLSQITASQNVSSFHQASGTLNIKADKQNQELGITITIEQGKYILLNVTAVMGITVARVLATPDSIVMLDMLHRKCVIASYAYVQQLLKAELGYKQLEQILLGNTPFPLTENCIPDSVLGKIIITQPLPSNQVQIAHFNPLFKVSKTELINRKDQQSFTVEYNQVYTKGTNLYPSALNINIRAEKSIESTLELSTFVFDKKKELQFTIPKSYEIQRL